MASTGPMWSFGEVQPFELQPIVVAGYDLVAYVLNNDRMCWNSGGVTLHAVYLLERLLFRMLKCDWKIIVVFFACGEESSFRTLPPAALMMARILCHHLRFLSSAQNTGVSVVEMESWGCKAWRMFCEEHAPSFILCRVPENVNDADLCVSASSSAAPLMIIAALQLQGIDVVSMDLSFKGKSVWSFQLKAVLHDLLGPTADKLPPIPAPTPASAAPATALLEAWSKVREACANDSAASAFSVAQQVMVAVLSATPSLTSSENRWNQCRSLLLHNIISSCIDLQDQCFSNTVVWPSNEPVKETNEAALDFLSEFYCQASILLQYLRSEVLLRDPSLASLIHGPVFLLVNRFIQRSCEAEDRTGMSAAASLHYQHLWGLFQRCSPSAEKVTLWPVDECALAHQDFILEIPLSTLSLPSEPSLAPVSCPVLDDAGQDEIFPCIADTTTESVAETTSPADMLFQYISRQLLVGEYEKSPKGLSHDSWKRKRQLKQHQKYLTYMHKFAETQNAKGTATSHIVLARSDNIGVMEQAQNTAKPKGKQKHQITNVKSRALKLTNEVALQRKSEEKYENRIQHIQSYFPTRLERIRELSVLIQAMKRSKEYPSIISKGHLLLLQLCWQEWQVASQRPEEPDRLSKAVYVFRLAIDAIHLHAGDYEDVTVRAVARNISLLGFKPLANELVKWHNRVRNKSLELLPDEPDKHHCFSVPSSCQQFQLLHCGHLMQRGFDTRPDPRVSGFEPDGWQRQLLDIVDRGESALVVAPTSSGKTFISFYTMQQVISKNLRRKSGEAKAFVVYVSPTKALVNQVAAEVYGKYQKALVGVFTRDFRFNDQNCEVLVTVPQCLELLLLTPQWATRMDYCILDEVHCIQGNSTEDDEGGIVWEHIISLLPCPFIALSATIANPTKFHSWLKLVQSRWANPKRGSKRNMQAWSRMAKVHLVEHHHRWADLLFFDYRPGNKTRFRCTRPKKALNELKEIHPFSCLSERDLRQGNWTSSVSFSSAHCVEMAEAMQRLVKKFDLDDGLKKRIAALDPLNFFDETSVITRNEVYQYEAAIKSVLNSLSEANGVLLRELHENLSRWSRTHSDKNADTEDSDVLASMLTELLAKERLPAIVFSLSRNKCTWMAKKTIGLLELFEQRDPEYRDELRKRARKVNDAIKAQTQGAKVLLGKSTKALKDQALQAEKCQMPAEVGPHPKYTYVPGHGTSTWSSEDQYWIDRAAKANCDSVLLRGLKRGIGVHHAGLPKQYRQAVEVLFRRGKLGFVMATGTLALGVNMPCRSVVLFGDSPFLSSLMFRQMTGRAGRRGFDDFGTVVFMGFTRRRINELITSKLTDITGIQPLKLSLVLRSSIFQAQSRKEHSDHAFLMAKGLLMPPLMTANSSSQQADAMWEHSKVLYRMYLEILYENHLIDTNGSPVGFASIASHLHYHEPANIVVCHLLNTGILKQLCMEFRSRKEATARKLLHFLAFIFNPLPLPPTMNRTAGSTSTVILQKLEPQYHDALSQFNDDTLRTCVKFFRFIASRKEREAPSLPVSGLVFGKSGAATAEGSLIHQLRTASKRTMVRSAYVALSGLDDECFRSAQELADTSDVRLSIEASQIPVNDLWDASGREIQLNSAVLDFYKHGQKRALEEENKLKEGMAWQMLKDWSLLLKAICRPLSDMMEVYTSPDTRRAIQQKLARDSNVTVGNDRGDTEPVDARFDGSEVPKAWDDDDSSDDGVGSDANVPPSWDDSDDGEAEDTPAESGAVEGEGEKDTGSEGLDMDYSLVLEAFEYLAETFGDRLCRFNQP